MQAFGDRRRGANTDTACALNISVDQSIQGQRLSGAMLRALRDAGQVRCANDTRSPGAADPQAPGTTHPNERVRRAATR